MSTIGAKVQSVPEAAASTAAMCALRSTSFKSQLAASASGMGKVVRQPWMMSLPMISGMPCFDSSTATRCRSLMYSAPNAPRSEPTRPSRISVLRSSSLVRATSGLSSERMPPGRWVNCPSFSSSDIAPSNSSTRFDAATCPAWGASASARDTYPASSTNASNALSRPAR